MWSVTKIIRNLQSVRIAVFALTIQFYTFLLLIISVLILFIKVKQKGKSAVEWSAAPKWAIDAFITLFIICK